MKNKKINLNSVKSSHKGFTGFIERFMRKFNLLFYSLLLLPLYLVASLCLGICLVPGIYIYQWMQTLTLQSSVLTQNVVTGFGLALGYFLYGLTLVFLAPLVNVLIRGQLKEWRGPYFSIEVLQWFLHNGLTYLVRYTFLEFLTPTPLSILFYQMMGMKIGRGVIINTTNISDPSLIEIGDKVTIGGSATLVAHYGQGGLIVIAPIKIGSNCTIGLRASIMGGVTIGDGAKVLPHSVVMPKTVIGAGETWGGVPALKIEKRDLVRKSS